MKNTIINKFVIVISLWLMAIIGINVFVGYETGLFGFHVVAILVATILLAINALHISLRVHQALRIQPKQAERINH